MTNLKNVLAGAAIASLILPVATFAQATSTSTTSIQTMLEQIKALNTQMAGLQVQQQTNIATLVATLKLGSNGDAVKQLQTILAQDPSLYPEGLVSGHFGKKTAQAVKRFQKKHGLAQVGIVGPKTWEKLNEMISEMGSSTITHNDADEKDKNNDGDCGHAKGRLTALGFLKNFGPKGDKKFKGNDEDSKPCTATTTPPTPADTIAPVISGVTVTGVATTSATISWTTNESATGNVYYSTTNPVNLATALMNVNPAFTGTHTFLLSGLTASSTYYFVLESKDASNNKATTTQIAFTTTN